jgi:hypothetical protein
VNRVRPLDEHVPGSALEGRAGEQAEQEAVRLRVAVGAADEDELMLVERRGHAVRHGCELGRRAGGFGGRRRHRQTASTQQPAHCQRKDEAAHRTPKVRHVQFT